ncbi:hypothetical protein Hdeb2414_s0006g00214021 [Helianthus debilis subsp. tardiflorus]
MHRCLAPQTNLSKKLLTVFKSNVIGAMMFVFRRIAQKKVDTCCHIARP